MFDRSRCAWLVASLVAAAVTAPMAGPGDVAATSFTAVNAPLVVARYFHTATLLPSGKVLLTGGYDDDFASAMSQAELYDPATGTSTATGSMTASRYLHSATLLPNGKVLIVGGSDGAGGPMNTAEEYDPAAGTFAATAGTLTTQREWHTATLLSSGKVLITGGHSGSAFLSSAELYDPATRTFTATSGPMTVARRYQTASLLPNGKVLIAGGQNGGTSLSSAELFDPALGTFAPTTGPMAAGRHAHFAVTLPSGKVLVAGGYNPGSLTLSSAELFDPALGTFSPTAGAMTTARYSPSATLLPSGKVLVAGGSGNDFYLTTAEEFNPTTGTFAATGTPLTTARVYHTATLLAGGEVLLAGGRDAASVPLATAERFDPGSGAFALTAGFMSDFRAFHTSTLLPNGKVLVTGGHDGAFGLNTAELFDPVAGTFSGTGSMTYARYYHTATLLGNGKVLVTGGYPLVGAIQNTAELYDPATGTFSPVTGTMVAARAFHTATLLSSGEVLLTGGVNNVTGTLNTAEVFNPSNATFRPASGPLVAARYNHTATLLPDGRVLIAGGTDGTALSSAELYSPATSTFAAAAGVMPTARYLHTSTLLPNGKVLIAGGMGGQVSGATATLFDPAGGTFSPTGNLTYARYSHTANLLANGTVFLSGGTYYSEVYDPSAGTFSTVPGGPAIHLQWSHAATLLPSGHVLLAGGSDGNFPTAAAQLYDPGLGFADARRPVVSSLTNPLCQPANLSLAGLRFTSDSEGSSGTTNNSATNAPLLRLQRVDNDHLQYLRPLVLSATSYVSPVVSGLASGPYRVAVVSNAIPSVERLIDIETPPLVPSYASTAAVPLSGSVTVNALSLPAGYNGALYAQQVSASPGFTGTLRVNSSTGAVTVTNAGPVGNFTITVSSSNACGAPTPATFTLQVVGPPASVVATAGTPQSTAINTVFGSPLQVTVTDAANHLLSGVVVTFVPPASGASAALANSGFATTNASGVASIAATANALTGSYTVTAFVGGLSAPFALTNGAAPIELLTNGNFSNGLANWQQFATPDLSYITAAVNSGVLEFSRTPPPPGPNNQATVFQVTGVPLPIGAPIVAQFQLGNSSTVRKYTKVLVIDSDFSDLAACTFWLPPGAPLQTYQMKTHATKAWTSAAIYFYASSANSGGDVGSYRVDNVSLQYAPAQAIDHTECTDPNAPSPPGGPAGANLLTNGDFGSNALAPWGLFGTITAQAPAGVLQMIRPTATPPAGVALQATGQTMTTGQLVTATFQLGNSSGVRKRVTAIMHDVDFSDLVACVFWLEPGQALSDYSITGWASKAWGSATMSFYAATIGPDQWTLVDNVTLRRTPSATTGGSSCVEPSGGARVVTD